MKSKLLILSLLLAPRWLPAASSGGAFLKIDPSARSYALGGSGVVTALGPESIGINPANLMSAVRKVEILTSYSSLSEGVGYAHIAGSIHRSTKRNLLVDALGFSYTRLSVSGFEGRDGSGNKTSDFASTDSQMSVSLAGNLKLGHVPASGRSYAGSRQGIQVGLTGKIVNSKIAQYKANTALAADMGASYGFKSFGKEMMLGASLNNLGQQIKYVNQKDSLPTTVNLGLTAQMGFLNLAGGLRQELKGATNLNLGAEFNLGMVSLRAGVNALPASSAGRGGGTSGLLEGLSSGIGLNLGMAKLDYALGQSSSDLGISHRISLTLQFGRESMGRKK